MRKNVIRIKRTTEGMTVCLCTDPKDVTSVVHTRFSTTVMDLEIVSNVEDFLPSHSNAADYKEVLERLAKCEQNNYVYLAIKVCTVSQGNDHLKVIIAAQEAASQFFISESVKLLQMSCDINQRLHEISESLPSLA